MVDSTPLHSADSLVEGVLASDDPNIQLLGMALSLLKQQAITSPAAPVVSQTAYKLPPLYVLIAVLILALIGAVGSLVGWSSHEAAGSSVATDVGKLGRESVRNNRAQIETLNIIRDKCIPKGEPDPTAQIRYSLETPQ